jgi:hypothetical protein
MMRISNDKFVLDRMLAEGHPIPSYIGYGQKEAAFRSSVAPSYHADDFDLTSQENVWLSHLKLACAEAMRPLTREIWQKKIAAAAERYGMTKDLDRVTEYVQQLREKNAGIETQADYEKARDWLFKNAEDIDRDTAANLSEHLQQAAIKIGHIPSLTEQYQLDEIAGRDPMTPEVQQYVEDHIHKLASGSVYTSGQFRCLSVDEVQEYLPELMKTASLGLGILSPQRFGKVAETLNPSQADMLDTLMSLHGERPIHGDYGVPVDICDEVLAWL